jgi:hypothetical protein
VFDTAILEKLKCYVDATDNADWADRKENPSRKLIVWHADSVIEELHTVCGNLTSLVQTELSTPDIEFMGIQLWKDSAGFNMSWHHDNPIIHVALQVYLLDSPSNYVTSFETGTEVLAVPHVHNTGYLLINTLKHTPTSTIANGATRYSLYAVWKLKERNAPC